MILRNYQVTLAHEASEILQRRGIVYLAFEMRVGKTLTALLAGKFMECKNVLFITKKKAISSIRSDFESFEFGFKIHICNYEQVDKAGTGYDLIIVDEAHSLGAFPKPSQRTRRIRSITGSTPLILLSGTPSPESYSQLYHQFWISTRSPFKKYKNFYAWSRDFVSVKEKIINGLRVRDYKNADRLKIEKTLSEYTLAYSQDEAGFTQRIEEHIRTVTMSIETQRLMSRLLKDRIVKLSSGEIVVADTAVKLQIKAHQLSSGTVLTENGKAIIIDDAKAKFIKGEFAGKRIAIFYKYKAEAEILRAHFNVTESPEEFNQYCGRVFISQVRSGAMGVNLSTADAIIFFNIDFSSQLYWQARARMQAQTRTKPCIVEWIFSDCGIERKIYNAVVKKKNYTTSYFMRDYGSAHSKTDRRLPA